ncbi:MAG TPA: malto-oligosyltrehalose synthase [Actinomycetota bacterium]|nr:malto-oligosyltrehalose synthase [Actinomycetota bacterium]
MRRDIPRATYRVQLNRDFKFQDLAAIGDYLAALGVSHVYCSPYLQAAPNSSHGYDVSDHTRLNEDLGGEPGFRVLITSLGRNGLEHIADIVPNHMSISGRSNPWWWDVLKHGRDSRYAHYFDIDWDPPDRPLKRKILLPVLGDHYGRTLEKGELEIAREGNEYIVRYHEHLFPLNEESTRDFGRGSIERTNQDPNAVHQLLERQHYRLAFWRIGDRELNYRRFFDIKTLIGLRVEDPDVFDQVHALPRELVYSGILAGLRVDHVDGLRDPTRYLKRLRSIIRDGYLIVEKILGENEALPDWPVDGTTGYDFGAGVLRLLLHPDGEVPLTETYARFIGHPIEFDELVRAAKLLVMREIFASDLKRLTELFVDVCEAHLDFRDYTRWELSETLLETIAAFPVYRTYADPSAGAISVRDVEVIETTLQRVAERRPDLDLELLYFLRDVLTLRWRGATEAELVARFQQTTGPAMAKGFEDTALYNYNRLIALNEVGSDPSRWTLGLEDFHAWNRARNASWPVGMVATSTHDSKRGEDVRARLAVLSEIPDQWEETVRLWATHNEQHRHGELPDRNTEYHFYQTLVGAWPLSEDRVLEYMRKAIREAKGRTSWTRPDSYYEAAVEQFVTDVLADSDFLNDVESFVAALQEAGRVNALTQCLLRLTAPGMPDIYQGSELWNLNLVDPDNRRPVDFDRRRRLLAEIASLPLPIVWSRSDEGLPKLLVTHRALAVRRDHPGAFAPGATYEPVVATGPHADRMIGFERGGRVITIAPRWHLRSGGVWDDTSIRLPPGAWREVFGGRLWSEDVALGSLLGEFPVALLVRTGS